jgi:hypothetical protein
MSVLHFKSKTLKELFRQNLNLLQQLQIYLLPAALLMKAGLASQLPAERFWIHHIRLDRLEALLHPIHLAF